MSGTLLFGGTDLATLCIVEDLSDFWSSSDLRGDLPTYPGVDGALAVGRPVGAKLCSGQVTVLEDDLPGTEDGVAAVKALLRQGQPQTITRRKVTGAGDLDTTQTAIVRTVAERWISDSGCTLLIGVELLDGLWHGDVLTIPASGTQDVAGDTRTQKMVITLPAGPARYVENTTTDHWLLFYAVVPSGGVEIDVENRTATAITGGGDLSQHLSWGKVSPMRLDPGPNALAVTDGTASIAYQPAYL